ncbi:MAG: branched-chain amino acid ABC transporter permease [Promethearchaeota archaeon]|nr:MAG: branched-chain amino acid ABC transporter permease [Candidatus Lokiarchaeota archaeon]
MIEEFIIFGAVQSAIYALLAMGYSLVYGVGKILNLAHGAYYVLATYIFYWFLSIFVGDIGFILGMILTLVFISIIGMLSYLLLIKPLQDHEISVLIGTFALAFFVEQLVSLLFDPRTKSISTIWGEQIEIFGVNILLHRIILIITALVVVGLITLFINKSKLGKSIRAVSQDREAASLMGINVDMILMYTVTISAFLAGLAAVFFSPIDRVAPYVGWIVLTDSIAIVILGGMDSLLGSLVGAIILGYVRMFTNFFIDPVISTIMPVIVIIIILIIRPRGLFGKKEIR